MQTGRHREHAHAASPGLEPPNQYLRESPQPRVGDNSKYVAPPALEAPPEAQLVVIFEERGNEMTTDIEFQIYE